MVGTAPRARRGSVGGVSREQRRERIRVASALSLWSKYPSLQTPADYAAGSMFHKSSLKAGMLKHSTKPVHKPLTTLPAAEVANAHTASKWLVEYTEGADGDEAAAAKLVEFLSLGREHLKPLSTELFFQLCKQWAQCPKESSRLRAGNAWALMAACVPVAEDAAPYICNFLISKQSDNDYPHAKFVLAQLRATGVQGYVDVLSKVPDVATVLASEAVVPRATALLHLDGSTFCPTVLVNSVVTGSDLLESLPELGHMSKDLRADLSLFIQASVTTDAATLAAEAEGKASDTTAIDPLDGRAQVAMALAVRGAKLMLGIQPEVLLDQLRAGTIDDDFAKAHPTYTTFVFAQLEYLLKSDQLSVPDQETAVPLVAMSLMVARGRTEPPASWQEVVAEGVVDLVPARLYRGEIHKKSWGRAIINYSRDFEMDGEEVEAAVRLAYIKEASAFLPSPDAE